MDLRVNDDAMKSLVAKAIVDSLTPEMREKLIGDAVTQTLTKPEQTSGYGRSTRSPLQIAFDHAVTNEAERYAREHLANDGAFKAQIEALFADVAKNLFESNRDDLISSIASTIRSALAKDRY